MVDANPSPVTTQPHKHEHHHHPHGDIDNEELATRARLRRLTQFLEAHFGEDDIEMYIPQPESEKPEDGEQRRDASIIIQLEEAEVYIDLVTLVS